MNEKLSRILLSIEALVLCLPISVLFFIGIPATIYSLGDELFEPFYVTVGANIFILMGIVAAWRLMISFVIFGNKSLMNTPKVWWVISCVIAILAVLASLYTHLVESFGPSSFLSFGWGVFFLPPLGHLLLERRRKKH
jgi:magnesium-transporting ATPase (P-type)